MNAIAEFVDGILDWLADHPGLCFAAFTAFFLLLLFFAFRMMKQEHDEFMASCMKDHKKYECQALYKGNGDTLIIPMQVPR